MYGFGIETVIFLKMFLVFIKLNKKLGRVERKA